MAYGKITVANLDGSAPLVLTFTEYEVYLAAYSRLTQLQHVKIIDEFWGYELFETAEQAVETVLHWFLPWKTSDD